MEIHDPEYDDFIAAAKYYEKEKGAAEIADKYGCTDKFIYRITGGKKPVGRKVQIKFSIACGFKTIGELITNHKKETDPHYSDEKIPQAVEERLSTLESLFSESKFTKEDYKSITPNIKKIEEQLIALAQYIENNHEGIDKKHKDAISEILHELKQAISPR